jgi:hypothetical protein
VIGLLGEAAWGLTTLAIGGAAATLAGGGTVGILLGVLVTVIVWAAGVLTMQHLTGWPPAE